MVDQLKNKDKVHLFYIAPLFLRGDLFAKKPSKLQPPKLLRVLPATSAWLNISKTPRGLPSKPYLDPMFTTHGTRMSYRLPEGCTPENERKSPKRGLRISKKNAASNHFRGWVTCSLLKMGVFPVNKGKFLLKPPFLGANCSISRSVLQWDVDHLPGEIS